MSTAGPSPLLPGATIGIVGGGQLGRMLAQVARRHGYRVVVFTGGAKDTPAGVIADEEIVGDFTDEHAVGRFVTLVDVITWEFENVDLAVAAAAETCGVPVRPDASVIAIAQDRVLEKEALIAAGLSVAPWRRAATEAELAEAVAELGVPVIAKAARFGYDGKGQIRIDAPADVAAAWESLHGQRLVVESVVPFERELSVIVARGVDGEMADHGVMENQHVHHILDTTMVPASTAPATTRAAVDIAYTLAAALDLVGVMCVELFDTGAGLIVNEIAPRSHNSGHCTIEAASASQFEQQLRAICGLPLGDGACRPAAMAQLLGDLWDNGEPDWDAVLAQPDIHLHLYGKTNPRPGRKMGHLTCVGSNPTLALQRVTDARVALIGR